MPTSPASQPLFMYSTVVSDVGTVRSNNQDSAFAGEHLIAICDGMGGHAGGDTASTIAIRSLAHIEQDNVQGDVQIIAHMMKTSVMAAHDAIVGKAKRERRLAGMGTTVTSVALVAGYWVLAHIGDSRAYLLHDDRLIRMTTDHSYVQHLIDTGRISESEARNHPQRNVVMRVLGDFDIDSRPDIAVRKAHPSDRWLLCSDGLCGVLEDSTLQEVLSTCSDQEECAQQLVSMALRAGSTDNVTAVIADATLALDADAFDMPHQTPLIGGAASASLEPIADIINEPVASAPALREGKKSPAARAAALRNGKNPDENDNPPEQRVAQPSTIREENGDRINPDTGEIPVVQKDDGRISADPNDPEVAKAIRNEHIEQRKTKRSRTKRNRVITIIVTIVILLGLAGGAFATYSWSQTKYYIGDNNGEVSIFQGVPTSLFGFQLSHAITDTNMKTSELPPSWQEQLAQGISFDTYGEAKTHTRLIKKQLKQQQDDEAQKKQDKTNSGSDSTSSSKSSDTASDKSSSKSGDSGNASSDKSGGDQS
ncbi:protein phosphatase 2C domain-containing protein [Bifidobacterium catenulatum]|uniref:PP2C family protein-serine/threonine phosphatase n=1 Tax=Bifidobacterium catenulatum TaxID=1686 RepID=UPI00232EC107|nr:PP2C family serine/threonine-protein phosphatase [Bifidobacterium catenulatum]MDB1139532.1 protein phosphatase 2C domain-containing protein [Bifidobacterium catenulatum]MDB1146088.1 protein phosphatase 2C domain-containing protein [Bifidobacterium catenulatum]MDB1158507.1 protein phosphatase 2C domain-containing protein [Bifidobacterium catenulatum]